MVRPRSRRRTDGRRRLNPMPDVTPIVNVALVLLIVFMVVMPMVREGITVEIPDARHSEQLSDAAEQLVVLSIQEDGSLFVNLNPVDRTTLRGVLSQAYRGQEGNPVIIKGARHLPYREILDLMELCQGLGVPTVDLMAKNAR